MWRLLLVLLFVPAAARAVEIVDATGRTVTIPDHVARVLPAGPPAAVLLLALAPDLMLGFPMDVAPEARAFLSPEAASLPRIPRLTGKEDVTDQIRALKPDLIVDYGDVTPAYVELAKKTQERLGVPVILLDGTLDKTPRALKALGEALHRGARADVVAKMVAAQLLAAQSHPSSSPPRRVVYLRGTDPWRAVAPGVGASDVFTLLKWRVVAPDGTGAFRPITLEQIIALDPDELVFSDSRMRAVVAGSAAWRGLRAVREGHAFVAPAVPFGWVEEPPSLNRLFAVAWLANSETPGGELNVPAAATFVDSILFGHTLTNAQLESLAESTRPLPP
jgi:iron complex transport system substrate-binding protein